MMGAMGILDIIGRLHIILVMDIHINPGGIMTGIVTKQRITMMGTGIMSIVIKDTEASLTVVIMTIITGMKNMNTITMGTGILGVNGKDIIEFIRTGSIMGDIIMMMTAIYFSGFATRMVAHVCSIQSEGNIGNG